MIQIEKTNPTLELVKAFSKDIDYDQKEMRQGLFEHDKKELALAFRLMRKDGLIALQNHTCCQSCGWGAISNRIKTNLESKGLPNGATFYHAQDAASRDAGEPIYLAYSHSGDSDEDSPMTTQEVGFIIVKCLSKAGIEWSWDGCRSSRILIHPKRWTQ